MVLRKVTWHHELTYSTWVQLHAYENLSVHRFVSGYLAVIDTAKPTQKPLMMKHLKELMSDAELYG